jgi:hypothetical protein
MMPQERRTAAVRQATPRRIHGTKVKTSPAATRLAIDRGWKNHGPFGEKDLGSGWLTRYRP